jgi:transcriptional regulator with XRE-family HTH domain
MPSSRTRSVLQNIAANVRARRVRLSLTQERVAEGAKLDLRHYQRVERGQVNVTIDVLVKLVGVLEMPLARLFRPNLLPPVLYGRPRKKLRRRERSTEEKRRSSSPHS